MQNTCNTGIPTHVLHPGSSTAHGTTHGDLDEHFVDTAEVQRAAVQVPPLQTGSRQCMRFSSPPPRQQTQ
jgi:hypothetical protein